MAGGPHAAAVMCTYCLARADRVSEGLETDRYVCSACRKEFGVDWSEGPPSTPAWPPSEEALAEARRYLALRAQLGAAAPPRLTGWRGWLARLLGRDR